MAKTVLIRDTEADPQQSFSDDLTGLTGATSIISVAKNGLVKDWDLGDLAGIHAVFIDPRAKPWQANHEYSNAGNGAVGAYFGATVIPSTNPNGVQFLAFENGAAVTGEAEPVWSEDGSTPLDDGTEARPMTWSPISGGIWPGLWQAVHAFGTGAVVIGAGYGWASDGGGNTGLIEPTWPATPDLSATVSDGGITWTSIGPTSVWAPSTRYPFVANADPTTGYSQSNVIPTDAVAGTSYVFVGQPTGVYGTTGATEPEGWEDAMPGDNSVWIDGDIMWSESTVEAKLVITGIVAPSASALLTIANAVPPGDVGAVVVEDRAKVENDYHDAALSEESNGFDNGSNNETLSTQVHGAFIYANERWQWSTPVAP